MSCLPPTLAAGTLLAAISISKTLGLPAPSAAAVLRATGAARTTAYKYMHLVEAALPELEGLPGRPPAESPAPPEAEIQRQVHVQVIDWIADHPGCIAGTAARRVYADAYRNFVLGLWDEHRDLGMEALAEAAGVAVPTMKDWVRGEVSQTTPPETLAAARPTPTIPQVETLLDAWKGWSGGFLDFCNHVQLHLRIPFGRKVIDDVLHAHGVRIPKRRGRRDRDASAQRGGFETFGAGIQWEGDGKELSVEINGVHYLCNLELLVDAHTDAFVGASVRPTEDSHAVTDAFSDGVATTGAAPIALLLDNKPSNHTEHVQQALGGTLRLRARPFQPTDKPHVEGAFGLFIQELPELCITATSPERLALQVAALVATAWARAANHRSRDDRGGKSRVGLYLGEQPTEEEKAQAEKALRERLRKQQRARETRAMRQDPVTHAILDDAFGRLCLLDPERHQRIAIASWPLEAVVEGIAIFEGKRRAGTLPQGVDARYLRGIVKNVAEEREGMEIAEALLKARLAAGDRLLAHLQKQRDQLDEKGLDPEDMIKDSVDRALASKRFIDRLFWLRLAADIILAEPPTTRSRLFHLAARRIHSTHRVPHRDRLAATRFLAAKVAPVE